MRKYAIHIILIFVLGFTFSIMVNDTKFEYMWTLNDWIKFVTYISSVVTPIATWGMLYVTYKMYKLNEESHRSETYFTKIVELYFKIEESHSHLEKAINNHKTENHVKKVENNIRTYVILLRRYLTFFSEKSHSVKDINIALTHIYLAPDCKEFYKELAERFETFCHFSKYNDFDKSLTLTLKRNKKGIFET